eukprot:CAMPEP_0197445334 /NCGR_PEP_ID=MMETSP1175-20131217/10580_1 /TAXON_ID=1003142 /ORGANISM="Triceratium dubium, Strain CCMP147" /LENGTH=414 /DNA_ID=CAMNT_0042976277 /DNA_START=438 /DNA_END=1682 /DNA_ORIENTATION=+
MRKKKENVDPYQRIMLGLSLFDIITSFFAFVLGSSMVPVETGWLWAAGNQQTCTLQGFWTSLGFLGSFEYQMALSLNLLMLITFGWSQKKFAEKIEKPMHCTILLSSFIYATVPLFYHGYNPSCINGQCTFDVIKDDNGSIIRGSEVLSAGCGLVFYATLLLMLVFCTTAMVWVYASVRRQENRMKKYRFGSNSDSASAREIARDESQNKESKKIRKILLLYTLALYMCLGVPFSVHWAVMIHQTIHGKAYHDHDLNFGSMLFSAFMVPFQGVFNCLVYFMPKALKRQRANPGTWLIAAYLDVLLPSKLFCGKITENGDGEGKSSTFGNFGRSVERFLSTRISRSRTVSLRSRTTTGSSDVEPSRAEPSRNVEGFDAANGFEGGADEMDEVETPGCERKKKTVTYDDEFVENAM